MSGEIRYRFAVEGAPEAAAAFRNVGQAASQLNTAAGSANLGKAAKDLQQVGVSAGQTAAAMRQLPAQFTDIATQLAGGQSPFLVLLQQGGQIKDSFGGIGAASRALLSVLTPTNLAIGAAAATLGTLAYAAISGERELHAYRQALVLTGNAAGTTSDALQQSAASVGKVVHSQGDAAAALAALAATGRVAGKDLEQLAEAALKLQREGGPAVADTVRQFAELGKSPTKAAAALNESTRFLTASVYEQIQALELQGKTAQAASVAQTAYASAVIARTGELAQNLGTLERGWRAVGNAAKGAWDAMLSLGRGESPAQKIAAVSHDLKLLQDRLSSTNVNQDFFGGKDRMKQQAEDLQEIIRLYQRGTTAAADFAAQQAEAARASEAGVKFAQLVQQFKAPSQALREQKALIQETGQAAGSSAEEIARLTGRMAALSAAGAQAVALAQAGINAVAALAAQQSARQLQDIQDRVRLGYQTELSSLYDIAQANNIAANAEVARLAAIYNSTPRIEENAATLKNLYGQIQVAAEKSAGVQVKGANDIAAAFKAIGDRTIAMRVLQWAEDADDAAKALVEYNKKLTAVNLSIYNYAVNLKDAAYAHEEELKASVLDDRQREIRLKQLQIELDTRRRIREVEAQNLSGDDKANKIAAIEAQAEKASRQAADQVTQAFDTRVFVSVRDTLTDAILEGGKGGAQRLQDLFKTLVLRPIVQASVQSLLGSAGFGSGGSLGSGSVVGQAAGIGNLFGLGSGLSNGIAAFNTSSLGQTLGLSSAFDIGGGSGVTMAATTQAGSLLSTAGPYAAAALAIYSLAKSLDSSGTPHFGGFFATNPDGSTNTAYGANESNRRAVYDQQVGSLLKPVNAALNGLIDAFNLGGKSVIAGSIRIEDAAKDAASAVVQIGLANGQTITNRADSTLPADATGAFSGFTALVDTSVRQALEQLDLPGWADSVLAKLDSTATTETILATVDQIVATKKALAALSGDFSTLGGVFAKVAGSSQDVQKQLSDLFGGVDSLRQAAGSYYQNFYSDAEKAARSTQLVSDALAAVGLVAPSTREAFRALVDAQDPLTESGQKTLMTLLGVQQAFSDLHPAAQAAADSSQAVADALRERQGIETELLRLQGNTTALRERELAALDTSNRALQQQVYALQDFNDAASANAKAVQDMANAAQQVAQAQSAVRGALQAVYAYGQGIRDNITQTEAALADVRTRAAADVQTTSDRVVQALRALTGASESAASEVKQAAQALDAAKGQRVQAATAIADALVQQQGVLGSARDSIRAALQGMADAATAAADKITEASKAVQAAKDQRGSVATSIAGLLDQQRGSVSSAQGSVLSALLGLRSNADAAGSARDVARANITNAYVSAQDTLTQATSRLAQLQGQASNTTADLAAQMGRLSTSIADYLAELTGSTADLKNQPDVARALFESTAAKAAGGDANAAAQLVDTAKRLIDASRAGSASGAVFDADVRRVRQVLAAVGVTAAAASGQTPASSNEQAIADALKAVSDAQAEVERLRGIAIEAGASLTAEKTDLLAVWRTAQDSAIAAAQAYADAAQQAHAQGIDEVTQAGAFALALGSFTSAQAQLDAMLGRVSAAGVDLSQADARDSLQKLLDDYSTANTAVVTAQDAYAAAITSSTTAAGLLAAAMTAAAAAGVTLTPAADAFSLALTAFNTARDDLDAMNAAFAGVDLSWADKTSPVQKLVDDYNKANTAIGAAQTTYQTALGNSSTAAQALADAMTAAAAAGVTLNTDTGNLAAEFAAALIALSTARTTLETVGNPAIAPDLLTEYGKLQTKLVGLNTDLASFDIRVNALDFSGLSDLDPLGTLLQTYSDAVATLVGAVDKQQAMNATGQFVDIGNGFKRYASTGGAVGIVNPSGAVTVFGKDGRNFGLSAIQDYVAGLLAQGDFRTIYNEATAFGLSSADLDRFANGAGTPVLQWAKSLGLPAFATGTAWVDQTGPAIIHQGERIIPAADNAALMRILSGNDGTADEVRALRAEVAALNEQLSSALASIAGITLRSTKVLERAAAPNGLYTSAAP